MQKVVTHNGAFHADDVFAVATLQLHFGIENVEVIRTRDEEIIASGDIVVDVGGVYDPAHQRFDHHQSGAPVRDNGIPYAAFGLIWKHYGEAVCGIKEIADKIEEKLVMPIDANDNGISIYQLTEHNIKPVTISDVIAILCPARGSAEDADASFLPTVTLARVIIEKTIAHAKEKAEMKALAAEVYERTEDKRVLQFDSPMSKSLMIDYPEVLFIISPEDPAGNQNWLATAIAVSKNTFELRQRFPKDWGGLRNEELVKVSGIKGAIFCHRNGFVFVAGSKEGVLEAVEKALEE
ncbi:MAG: MYG1 family protein [Candidatus Paceibacterota bacterium]